MPRVTRLKVALPAVVLIAVVAGCGNSATTTETSATTSDTIGDTLSAPQAAQDSYGDPYVTDDQMNQIRKGMSASAAFAALGGRADSGYNGGQAGPTRSYDYPVRGTGNPDDVSDDS